MESKYSLYNNKDQLILPSINNNNQNSINSSGGKQLIGGGLRSNNIAFMRADERPYHKEGLSEFIKSERNNSYYGGNSNINNYNDNNMNPMRQSIQSQKSNKNNTIAQNPMVDQILQSRMNMNTNNSLNDFNNNNSMVINPFLKSDQFRLSQHQLEDRQMALSRASNLQMDYKLQQHQNDMNMSQQQSIGSRGSQRQLPPLRQSSSRGQLGGSLKPLHLDENDIGYHSQQTTKYPLGLINQNTNNKPSITFQSQLGKVATTVQAKVNVYNEGEDEIQFNTVTKLLDDEVDQDRIIAMESNLENMKEQVELAKYKYEQKQLNDLETKEREMLNRIDQLQDVAEEDHEWRHAVRDKLIQMKLRQQEIEKREKQYEEYIHRMERETEVEKLVRKKLEIEKMRQQQELLDELQRKKQSELQGIGTELSKKDVDSADMLKKALQRADVLQKQIDSGTIDTKTQSLLVDAILDKNPENEQIRKQILEEIKAKMSRDKDDQQYKNEELMQQLNMQRMRFLEAERVIKEKKQMHQEIMRRGMDFLTEIELGNAPPLEYVVKNIYQSRPPQQDQYNANSNQQQQPEPVKQTVQIVQQNLRVEEQKLKDLMNEYQRTLNMIQDTSTDLKLANPDRYRIHNIPEYKRAIVQPVIDQIIEGVFRTVEQREFDAIESKKIINRLKMQKEAREARIDQLAGTISLKELNEAIIQSVVEQMAKQIAQESLRLNDLAMMKSFELIVKALKTQKGFKNSELEMRKVIMGMQGQHLEERKMDVHKIHHSLFVMSGSNAGRLAEIKVQNEQKQEQKKDKNMKDEDFIDENADVLDPSECLTFINNNEVKLIERDYFGPVNLEKCHLFGATLGNKSGGVTALAVSHNKQLVAEAVNNGQILVYNIAKNYQLMRKITTKNTNVYTNIEFSRDNISQLIAVSVAGSVVKSFLMKDKNELPPIDPNQAQGKSVSQVLDMRTLIEDQPSDLVPYFEVNYEQFLTPDIKKDKNAQKEYAITTAQFHSQISQNGFQDYIIVGSKAGSIIRYNANPPPSSNPNSSQQNNASNSKEMFNNAKKSNVDFILGHKVPIVFLQSIENPTNPLQCPQVIVSIDVAGHIFIWKKPQDREKFPSKPSAKYRLAMSYHKFVKSGETRIFPQGKEKEIDPAKSINAKIMTTITTYMQNNGVTMSDIEAKSIDRTTKNPSGVQIMMLPIQRPPENEQMREFEEYIFNGQGMLTRRAEIKYKFEESVAKLGSIKSSKNKRFIVIQMIKDHVFAQKDFFTHEFIIFRSEEYRLGKYKVTLNMEKNAILDFDISDEVQSLGFPYLYILNNTQVSIISILTNTMIKTFDYAQDFAKLSKKKVKFDKITIGSYQDIFLNSTQFDATLHIKLENLNSPERHTEFVRMYSKLNECWK